MNLKGGKKKTVSKTAAFSCSNLLVTILSCHLYLQTYVFRFSMWKKVVEIQTQTHNRETRLLCLTATPYNNDTQKLALPGSLTKLEGEGLGGWEPSSTCMRV